MVKLLTISLLVACNACFACTCINSRPLTKKEFRAYHTVAKVRILDVAISPESKRIVVEVIELYRGLERNRSTFVVITEPDPGMCGIDPKKNETWLMYSVKKGHFDYTDLCTKSKKIDPAAGGNGRDAKLLRREIRFLQNQQVKRNE